VETVLTFGGIRTKLGFLDNMKNTGHTGFSGLFGYLRPVLQTSALVVD